MVQDTGVSTTLRASFLIVSLLPRPDSLIEAVTSLIRQRPSTLLTSTSLISSMPTYPCTSYSPPASD